MVFGKILAGALGFAIGNVPGLIVGILVGHGFDRGLAGQFALANPERLARMQQSFFQTSFQLLGHVAKADGRVSEIEIAQAEALMRQLGIQGPSRDAAIEHFRLGAASEFDLEAALASFKADCAGPRQIVYTLLEFLISMALADGVIDPGERQVLTRVATVLGYTDQEFRRLLDMLEAQSHFHQPGAAPAQDQLADAYKALGVAPDCTDRDLKRAYRRLMSEHHPDKLVARGVPESMMKLATEKAQEIQAAYEVVSKSRKGS